MEALISIQEECLHNLRRAERNFKKTPKERIKRTFIETKLEMLEQQYKEFKEGHKAVVMQSSKDRHEPYFTEGVYECFEEVYVSYKITLRDALQTFLLPPPTSAAGKEEKYGDLVKLPRIILPMFSGKYEEWQIFYDMFLSLIHNNKTISPVQKLHYLKGNLVGEAQNLLRNFSTTDANYEEAWKQLVRRYNNKRYNCNTIMRSLFASKKINGESAHAIKELVDNTTTCLKSLQNMGINTSSWDVFIIFLVISKLDSESVKQWEQQLTTINDELPTWEQLREYLEGRFRALEMINTGMARPSQSAKSKSFHTYFENKSGFKSVECAKCRDSHLIIHCKQFVAMTPKERQDFVQNKKLCFNCLSPTHTAIKCRQSSCRRCGRRHHTLLHFDKNTGSVVSTNEDAALTSSTDPKSASTSPGDQSVTVAFSRGGIQPYSVLLATAKVKVNDSYGCKQIIRALLDQGSQASFVTEATAQLLGLVRKPVSGWVSGLGDGRMSIKYSVSLRVESRHSPENFIFVDAYVLHSLTSLLPACKISMPEWTDIESLPLADPSYTTPGKIDILLGADAYGEILLEGIIKNPERRLVAQNTIFGWILSGKASRASEKQSKVNFNSLHLQIREDELLKKFWEMEDEPNMIQRDMTKEEKLCEQFFDATTTRDEDGRFRVRLPFASDDPKCKYGNSRDVCVKRLEILERKLEKNPLLREEYNAVMSEYLSMNHMRLISENERDNPYAVYLPHHAVVREDKETTKVRVVFDASSKGTNGISLNDDLLVGPKLQQDLRHILMRWRNHRICIVADIIKMYRMVCVAEEDNEYQRVLWRFTADRSEPIQDYKLLRLTFGTACAPYLAVKSLQRLAELEQDRYPLAAKVAEQDFYMDDLISGRHTEEEALKLCNEMTELLKAGGFQLQKWNSNCDSLLQIIRRKDEQEKSDPIKLNKRIKILGVSWCRDTDHFEYVLNLPENEKPVTKRQVLSDIARLYDPLGFIAPVLITAKIFIQRLWKSGLKWDDCLSEELIKQWTAYRRELHDLKHFTLPRWLNTTPNSKTELHVFSDASKSAYAAAVYARVIDESNSIHVHLVTAKTKVTPIEKEISIPRLELCGASLAAKLILEVSQVMDIPRENLHGWTDSTIVLAWLKGGSSRWATFVSNRVSAILNILDYEQWSHVPTETNPADCASRGLSPKELIDHTIWLQGPSWLADNPIQLQDNIVEDTHEEERVNSYTVLSSCDLNEFIWDRFSSLSRLLRVTSYCRRLLNLKLHKDERVKFSRFVTVEEINMSLLVCIKKVQEIEFEMEIRQLLTKNCVAKKSKLRTLCPFLDKKGVLRVSGRINQSDLCYDTRHPIIMPAKNHFTKLLIVDAHFQTKHGGPQLMQNFLRTKYWILRSKERIKKVYRECVICSRYSARKNIPLMGLLPEARLKPSKPFKSSGVDYCGPVNIRFSPGRGSKSYKGYVCLFVCMVTRAIHLEAVTDLSAKGFIAAFRRFSARRGHCQDLYCDNGTNFVGADRELREMFDRAKSQIPEEIAAQLTLERTAFHFIPPRGANFGGLWEAGVRSTKTHLIKVVGNTTLTYEELATVLAQVEACLNSRPISLLSDDPNDPLPLTPGHFLVGEPLLNIADNDYSQCNVVGLERWRLTQKIVNDFWNRWYKEYLVNLNQRYKWNKNCPEFQIGDIVLLKEDNTPPAKWILGRIIDTFPGPDNITRVVSVKCKSGTFKRPVNKLCMITK